MIYLGFFITFSKKLSYWITSNLLFRKSAFYHHFNTRWAKIVFGNCSSCTYTFLHLMSHCVVELPFLSCTQNQKAFKNSNIFWLVFRWTTTSLNRAKVTQMLLKIVKSVEFQVCHQKKRKICNLFDDPMHYI